MLNLGLGGVSEVVSANISHEQTRTNRVVLMLYVHVISFQIILILRIPVLCDIINMCFQALNGERIPKNQKDKVGFISKYEGRKNGGIPCFAEERSVERAAKVQKITKIILTIYFALKLHLTNDRRYLFFSVTICLLIGHVI